MENHKFNFIRHKSLGRLDMSHISTEVDVDDLTINIKQQKIILYFFKKKAKEMKLDINRISEIKVLNSLDISDMIFSAIFAILGFLNPIFFIGAILLFVIGRGKKIKISIPEGDIIIPTEIGGEYEELLKVLK